MKKRFRGFFTRKRIIWISVAAGAFLLVWFFFIRESANSSIQSAEIVKQDIKKTVLTTGQVVSETDLSLSFQSGGVVRKLNVKEGDNVKAGQVLAVLDQSNAIAGLESAKASLAQAQANYSKIHSGVTSEDIAVSQAAVNIAQSTLDNARQTLLNKISSSYNDANTSVLSYTNILFSNPFSTAPQFGISGTVQTNGETVTRVNDARVMVNGILLDWQKKVAGITNENLDLVALDSLSYLTKISDYLSSIITLITSYTQLTTGGSQSTLTAYQSGVGTAKSTVDSAHGAIVSDIQAVKNAVNSIAQAKASLSLKQAPARPEDVSIAEAQVLGAQGQVHLAEASLNNTVIVAPSSGTITQVNIKLGEQASASKEVIKLLNVSELHAEAQVSEADITAVTVGQEIDNTFDALGPDRHFQSRVLTVNPASTVVSGVVNYKVTGSLENIPGIKPGMTANMTILVAEKKDVVIVPSSSIINQDGKKFVRIIDDLKTKTYHQVEVKTGLEADGGEVEVISGVNLGQWVVTYIK